MAANRTNKPVALDPTDSNAHAPTTEPLPGTNDPGGAHTKGYSADPFPDSQVKEEGPIPLTPVTDSETQVRQPERDGRVRPTGRSEHGEYTPNDRLMGSDR